MATPTRSRPRGREHARPSTGGAAAEHATKIYTIAIAGIVVIVAFLALTSIGHVIDAATQHFMLFYAGVFALIALCASVGLGLVATDRMILNPGHRVFIQSAHRAASFGAVTFLIIHIVTEILAQRVHVLDAVIPFLSPFRTFYIGLGTIASDLILLLVITGILRGRFNSSGKAWRWRAIHYTSYAAFVFGVWHGLLGGRPGKPYVDWSYGFIVAFVVLGLAVRVLSNSLRPKENLSAPPVDMASASSSAPLRAAAMFANLGGLRGGRQGSLGMPSGPQPVMSASVRAPVLTALPVGSTPTGPGQPYYEPGYEGPPRYLGAPRGDSGPMPRAGTGPFPVADTGTLPPYSASNSGPMPRATSGPMPRATSGPMPRATSGPMPRATSGPMPRTATGPNPRFTTGPLPYGESGSYSGPPTGPQSWPGAGQPPRSATGPQPQFGADRQPDWDADPMYRPATGPMRRPPTGPMPRSATGPMARPASGPMPRSATGPMPMANGTRPRPGTGPIPQYDGPLPPSGRADSGGWPSGGGGWSSGNGGQPGADVWYGDENPWDGRYPESDPNLKYREPGPGMPGYRGSRDHRYGGDVR